MGRYSRGPKIEDVETAVFCLLAGDHLYHGTAILPAVQIMTWPLNKIRERVTSGKLFKAEFTGTK
jgi:hypothetical protein